MLFKSALIVLVTWLVGVLFFAAWETWSTCHCLSALRCSCSRFFALVKRPCGA